MNECSPWNIKMQALTSPTSRPAFASFIFHLIFSNWTEYWSNCLFFKWGWPTWKHEIFISSRASCKIKKIALSNFNKILASRWQANCSNYRKGTKLGLDNYNCLGDVTRVEVDFLNFFVKRNISKFVSAQRRWL